MTSISPPSAHVPHDASAPAEGSPQPDVAVPSVRANLRGWMPARPRLKPALRRLARDERTLQLGLHPPHAVMVTDLEPRVRAFVESLDGTRTLHELIGGCGLQEETVRRVVSLLAEHGLLDDAAVRPEPLRGLSTAERDRLAPDLDALSLSPADAGDGGLSALDRRRGAHVRVYGAGRVGAQITVLLAASGVGNVCVIDPGPARPADVVPGGLSFAEVGRSREEGAVAAARRVAPGVNAWAGRTASQLSDRAHRPDLVVLAPVGPFDGVLADELVTLRIPHLLVSACEGVGSVGPLVIPGRTPCLRCLDLTRCDRDPSWPQIRARLGGFPAGEVACGTVLSTLVAAQAAGQALGSVDGIRQNVTNGTVDVMPDGRWKKRSWDPHPRCRCSGNQFSPLTMVA
ncbi:ThiF family adenylyltransferase [Sphaerisporangium sp. TRM90804]|uniref:ThiF family adenylyltransferase n=1 Tax=Sphaerisporangium sp. TRM90804 TaxID=3031113 RepID=UPI002446CC7B|nr:ThiF family adenylyltransferase [Sphaerisporangium sp. TRM90804]MDH2429800.1 ThiF family adenylyltransferase [Sphaerisporangium sp. TRM90804]